MTGNASSRANELIVSVVLASHNGADFIAEQLGSIVKQSLPPDEVLLTDDASTDGTVDVARNAFAAAVLEAGDPDIRLTVIANATVRGVARNFEAGCVASSGDLIALSDQDDVWEPDRLAVMVREFTTDPSLVLLHSNASLIDADGDFLPGSLFSAIRLSGRERRTVAAGHEFAVLLRRNIVTGATTIFRRELLERARPFPDGWVHDEWLGVVAAATGNARLLDGKLTRYRQHSSNQIGATAITVRGGLNRIRESRDQRNARLLEHAHTLVERTRDRDDLASADYATEAMRKLAHEEFRSALPRARLARIPGIARAFARGHYGRYSRGVVDAFRDFVQPA